MNNVKSASFFQSQELHQKLSNVINLQCVESLIVYSMTGYIQLYSPHIYICRPPLYFNPIIQSSVVALRRLRSFIFYYFDSEPVSFVSTSTTVAGAGGALTRTFCSSPITTGIVSIIPCHRVPKQEGKLTSLPQHVARHNCNRQCHNSHRHLPRHRLIPLRQLLLPSWQRPCPSRFTDIIHNLRIQRT